MEFLLFLILICLVFILIALVSPPEKRGSRLFLGLIIILGALALLGTCALIFVAIP